MQASQTALCPRPPLLPSRPPFPTRSKLSTASETIEQWLTVQNMWMYMEAVFSGGDIVKQLPQEAKRFQNIDKNFMKARRQGRGDRCGCCGHYIGGERDCFRSRIYAPAWPTGSHWRVHRWIAPACRSAGRLLCHALLHLPCRWWRTPARR